MNQSVSTNPTKKEPVISIKASDLPLSCPTKNSETWNAHPRVFLDLSKSGSAKCSYCGAQYQLEN